MENVVNSDAMQLLATLLVAIAAGSLWRWPEKYHPLTLFRLLADGMAKKVRPKEPEPISQHKLSGALGAIVLIVPFIVLLALLVNMAEYPLFFEAIILISALDFAGVRWRYNQVVTALQKGKKVLAREAVSNMVARDCNRLSDIGVAKAAMESYLLRFYYQFCGVVVWFLIGGPVVALLFRLLLVFTWQWHWRRPGYYWFAIPVRRTCRLTALLPAFLGAILFSLVTHPINSIKAWKRCELKDTTSWLLALSGGGLGVKLGGPAMYADNMIRYARVGGDREVRFSDLIYCRRAITRAILLLCGLSLLCLTLIHVFRSMPNLTI